MAFHLQQYNFAVLIPELPIQVESRRGLFAGRRGRAGRHHLAPRRRDDLRRLDAKISGLDKSRSRAPTAQPNSGKRRRHEKCFPTAEFQIRPAGSGSLFGRKGLAEATHTGSCFKESFLET